MVADTLEIERKYDTDTTTVPSLDGLPGVSAVDGPRRQLLDAIYYDTDDLRLVRAGITLRRRTGGDDAGWHLKLPAGGVGERLELRLPPGRAANTVPPELVELTLARTRGAQLHRVGRLRTTRDRWELRTAARAGVWSVPSCCVPGCPARGNGRPRQGASLDGRWLIHQPEPHAAGVRYGYVGVRHGYAGVRYGYAGVRHGYAGVRHGWVSRGCRWLGGRRRFARFRR
jgi:hypothetical protein